MEVLIIYHM